MPRVPREPPSPSALVPALLRYLAARGHDPAMLVGRFALPPEAIEHDTLEVVPATINDLLEAAAELLAEPFLALRLPSELPFRRYDVVELALRSSPSLRDGLLTTARHATAIHPQLELALVEDGAEALWFQRTPGHPRGIGRHAHEYGLAYVLLNARIGLAEVLPVTRVWFSHPRPRALEPLHRLFGTEDLVFGAPDSGFGFAPALLDAPLHGDRRMLATVEALAPASPSPRTSALFARRLAAYLRDHLSAPAPTAAAALHMSARTLQRRLAAEGTTFSAVVDEAREALARELLADRSRPLAEVADRVGFADLATFSRAFKRWTGKPPGLFRRS